MRQGFALKIRAHHLQFCKSSSLDFSPKQVPLFGMPTLNWSEWRLLPLQITADVLSELLDGGQSFRWRQQDDGTWVGIWGSHVARLAQTDKGELRWSAPREIAAVVEPALKTYLGLDSAFAAQIDSLPWRSDAHLAACLRTFPGLRILRQPFGETLLGFICSATKQIVQIKQMIALLAERHGAEIVPGFHRLPTWEELARVSENTLRECKLGFRAKHIHSTAQFLAKNPGWLDATEAAPYATAKERLCTLPGVGEKVADCVLLFGAGRLDAFPVDTWIIKTMARRYGLDGWPPAQIAHFGRTHFGPLAGLAQQYLFAHERAAAKPIVI